MQVEEIMSRNPVNLSPYRTVHEAAEMMRNHNIGAIPVADKGVVKGIITDRDIVLRCVAGHKDPQATAVKDVMTGSPVLVEAESTVEDAAHIMASQQVRRLPVVKSGMLAGMLSFADITRGNSDAEIADTISDISMP